MSCKKRAIYTLLLAIIIPMASGLNIGSTNAADAPVIINEIMYNPSSGDQDEEFLELHNTTGSTISLDGWCFTQGINLCFQAGISIAAQGYLIVSPSSSSTLTAYGLTPSTIYAGNLSNGGETLTLKDADGVTVTSFTYGDKSPWVSSPDGTGPSLELKDPNLNLGEASSWGASLGSGGTPLQLNSLSGLDIPTLSQLQQPSNVMPGGASTVTVQVENATAVELKYKILFGAEQTAIMYDDGAHSDGSAGDGVYGAQIPGQVAGALIRYKVVASNINGAETLPSAGETITYLGYIVQMDSISSTPLFNWYMDPNEYNDMITNHLGDDVQFSAVVGFGGKVIDNVLVRVKGNSNLYLAKKKFKFDLPQGHTLGDPYFAHPVDEFALNATIITPLPLSEDLAWKIAREAGFVSPQTQMTDVHLSTSSDPQESLGLYLLTETFDKSWRERNGFEEGAFYKGAVDKKTRLDEDNSDIEELIDNLQNLTGDDLKNYILDNLDVPSFINFDATMSVSRSFDWTFQQNMYQYRDSDGTQRWSVLPDDLDVAMNPVYLEGFEWNYSNLTTITRLVGEAMYQYPEFREAYARRSTELFERVYGGQNRPIDGWIDEIYSEATESLNNDNNLWGQDRLDIMSSESKNLVVDSPLLAPYETFGDLFGAFNATNSRNFYRYDVERSINAMSNSRQAGTLPSPQPSTAKVFINEINYNPAGGSDHEFVELYNPNDFAVDISGWRFSSGIDMTFKGGSVINAKSYGLVVKNDTAFRAHYGGGKLILGQYGGFLSNEGETVALKREDDSSASVVNYQTSDPWPGSANGGGSTLSLGFLGADETLVACWAPSPNGGTPGLANQPAAEWIQNSGNNCLSKQVGQNPFTGPSSAFFRLLSQYLPGYSAELNNNEFSQSLEDPSYKSERVLPDSAVLSVPLVTSKTNRSLPLFILAIFGLGIVLFLLKKSRKENPS